MFKGFLKTFRLFKAYVFCVQGAWGRLFLCFLLAILEVGVTVGLPQSMKRLVNFLSGDITLSFGLLFGVFLFFTLADRILHYLEDLIFFPIVNRAIRDLTEETVTHFHALPWQEVRHISLGHLLSSLKRISLSARFFIRSCFLTGPTYIFKFIVSWVVLLKLGLFTIEIALSFFLFLSVFYYTMRWYLGTRSSSWKKTDRVTDGVKDSLLQTKFVRFFLEAERKRLKGYLQEEAKSWIKTNKHLNFMLILLGGCLTLITGFVILRGIQFVLRGTLTVGDFILLKSQLAAAFMPFRRWLVESRQVFEAVVDIENVLAVLEKPLPFQKGILEEEKISGDTQEAFKLRHVSFSYTSEKPLLKDVNFSIPRGTAGILWGPTGGGKSTLLHLLTGLLKPSEGEIKILGRERKEGSLLSPSLVYFIPQETYLFNQSLRYNLLYGLERSVEDEELWSVLEKINLKEWVLSLPRQLETSLGDLGTQISGGERQKVILARALLLRPQILILDETTSALDEETEQKVFRILKKEIQTLLLATHRSSLRNQGDWSAYVQNGHVSLKFLRDQKMKKFS